MIAAMPKRRSKTNSIDGRSARYKPVSSHLLAIWAKDLADFAATLRDAAKSSEDNGISEVAFDGATGFTEVVERVERAAEEAAADIRKRVRRENRSA